MKYPITFIVTSENKNPKTPVLRRKTLIKNDSFQDAQLLASVMWVVPY